MPSRQGPLGDPARGDSALAGLRPGRFCWDFVGGERDWGRRRWGGSCPHPQSLERAAAAAACGKSGSEHPGGEFSGHLLRAEEPQEDECCLDRRRGAWDLAGLKAQRAVPPEPRVATGDEMAPGFCGCGGRKAPQSSCSAQGGRARWASGLRLHPLPLQERPPQAGSQRLGGRDPKGGRQHPWGRRAHPECREGQGGGQRGPARHGCTCGYCRVAVASALLGHGSLPDNESKTSK